MIQTTLPHFLALITTVFLAGVFLLWILSEMVRRNRQRHTLKKRVQCNLCGTVFDDLNTTILSKCPQCGRMNERQPLLEI